MFLHWVIDPTLHPRLWCWGDYRDERGWKVGEGVNVCGGEEQG